MPEIINKEDVNELINDDVLGCYKADIIHKLMDMHLINYDHINMILINNSLGKNKADVLKQIIWSYVLNEDQINFILKDKSIGYDKGGVIFQFIEKYKRLSDKKVDLILKDDSMNNCYGNSNKVYSIINLMDKGYVFNDEQLNSILTDESMIKEKYWLLKRLLNEYQFSEEQLKIIFRDRFMDEQLKSFILKQIMDTQKAATTKMGEVAKYRIIGYCRLYCLNRETLAFSW
jgi:uncharacterized protein (UPF0248 family)